MDKKIDSILEWNAKNSYWQKRWMTLDTLRHGSSSKELIKTEKIEAEEMKGMRKISSSFSLPSCQVEESRKKFSSILVTGGAGFIGSCFVKQIINRAELVSVVDKLTYAGNIGNLEPVRFLSNFAFYHADIADAKAITKILELASPDVIVNFAAETHVDRSILDPAEFVQTNVVGTEVLLRCALSYYENLPANRKQQFRFIQISTDEVYGSLGLKDDPFTESSPLAPNSPYSASKASADLLCRSYLKTFGLPVIITRCSNNYGPAQYPEKLIPFMISRALKGDSLPVYGNGENIRDWIHVEDHCRAIELVMEKGEIGQTYNIGASEEKSNISLVRTLCALLDEMRPRKDGKSYFEQITFVKDRAGHDFRYALDSEKIRRELGWEPRKSFEQAFRDTVHWYLEHPDGNPADESLTYDEWFDKYFSSDDSGLREGHKGES